jgi:hypothetical protein
MRSHALGGFFDDWLLLRGGIPCADAEFDRRRGSRSSAIHCRAERSVDGGSRCLKRRRVGPNAAGISSNRRDTPVAPELGFDEERPPARRTFQGTAVSTTRASEASDPAIVHEAAPVAGRPATVMRSRSRESRRRCADAPEGTRSALRIATLIHRRQANLVGSAATGATVMGAVKRTSRGPSSVRPLRPKYSGSRRYSRKRLIIHAHCALSSLPSALSGAGNPVRWTIMRATTPERMDAGEPTGGNTKGRLFLNRKPCVDRCLDRLRGWAFCGQEGGPSATQRRAL